MQQLGAIAIAADKAVREQTPPKGGGGAWYRCPACPQEREIRGDIRKHMIMCDAFREMVVGEVITTAHPMAPKPTMVS